MNHAARAKKCRPSPIYYNEGIFDNREIENLPGLQLLDKENFHHKI
jgi:hypothetical protein